MALKAPIILISLVIGSMLISCMCPAPTGPGTATADEGGRALADSAWPMVGHDTGHTGQSQFNTTNNWGAMKWTFQVYNFVRTSPVIGPDGVVYIGGFGNQFHAINPDGSQKWVYSFPGPPDNLYCITSTAAIDSDGNLFFTALHAISGNPSWEGMLVALKKDGTKKWEYKVDNSDIYSSPAIDPNNIIYFGWNKYVYALNSDGTLKWKFTIDGQFYYCDPAIGPDGTIYVSGERFLAFDPDGRLRWALGTHDNRWSLPVLGAPTGALLSDPTLTGWRRMHRSGPSSSCRLKLLPNWFSSDDDCPVVSYSVGWTR
jgi:outer membrane protein assembly factor BamB